MKFESLGKCLEYSTGTVKIHLPKEKRVCQYCVMLRYEESYKRFSCRISGEWIFDPFNGIPEHCPITWGDET